MYYMFICCILCMEQNLYEYKFLKIKNIFCTLNYNLFNWTHVLKRVVEFNLTTTLSQLFTYQH